MNQPDLFTHYSASDYPDVPGALRSGPSEEAARKVTQKAALIRERVAAAIKAAGPLGLTADECADVIRVDFANVRPRCTELSQNTRTRLALIEASGRRRPSRTGNPQTVWVAI